MRKFKSKIILFTALILVLVKQDIFAYEVFVNNKYICEKQRGIWREFGDDCADICDKRSEHLPICTKSVAVFSCDCGKNKCWDSNNEECILIKDYKAAIKKAEEERKRVAEEAKKKLEEEKAKLAEKNSKSSTESNNTNVTSPFSPSASTPDSDPNADFIAYLSQTCKSFGGEWKNFGNSCAGTCEAKASSSPQTFTCSALTSNSCDCGEDRCWYQNKCMKTEDYKKEKSINNTDNNNSNANSNNTIENNPLPNATDKPTNSTTIPINSPTTIEQTK